MNTYSKLLFTLTLLVVGFFVSAEINNVYAYDCSRCSDTYAHTWASWTEDDTVCDRDGYETVTYSCNCACHIGSASYSGCDAFCCQQCYAPACGNTACGNSCTTYSSSSVACGSTCSSISRTSTCNDGSYSIAPYSNSSCSVSSCSSCYSSACGTVAHGGSCTTYLSSSVSCGSSCTSRSSTCNNGSWSVTPYSYSYCSASCSSCYSAACGTVAHGSSCTTYSTDSPSCGSACSTVSRSSTCNDGSWNLAPYSNSSCTAKCCASGGCSQTNQGGTCTSYSASAPACGTGCTSRSSTCQSTGLWSTTPYANSSCTACCNLPWGGTITGGNSVTAYSATSTTCPSACTDIDQVRTCNSSTGLLDGTASYQYQSCTTGQCAACNLPWGGTIAHGQSVTAYLASSVACGDSCLSQVRTCSNGTLGGSASYQYQTCNSDCPCQFPIKGNHTLTSSCGFGALSGRVDGVDDGTGIVNSGQLTIDNGATLTIGTGDNQTLTYGQINLVNGSIVIAKDANAQLKKAPVWIEDADGDNYKKASATLQANSSQPAGFTRRNLATTLQDGLVAYWNMNQAQSPSSDSSLVSTNNATWYNSPTSVAGKYGTAVNYNGSNQYLSTTLSQNLGQPFTWAAWINIATSATHSRIFGQGNTNLSGLTGMAVAVASSTRKVRVLYPLGYADTAAAISLSEWHHIAVTRAANGTNNIKVYIDGVNSPLDNETASPSDSTSPFEIGRIYQQSTYYYEGANKKIDEVRVFNRALSATEVYNLAKVDAANDVYYPTDCDDTSASRWKTVSAYADTDQDGYGTGSLVDACGGDTLSAGYSLNNTDCSEASANIYQTVANTAQDTDQDGYATSSTGSNCLGASTLVSGRTYHRDTSGNYSYVVNPIATSDCAASDNTKWQNLACSLGTPTTISYLGSQQTYVVPAGVTSVQIEAWGGKGAAKINDGGYGGYAKGTFTVTPGETLYVYTGGQGSGSTAGYNGGGAYGNGYSTYDGGAGGGATDVRRGGTALANRIIVAGGGGGAGGRYSSTYGTGGEGGDGGAATGQTGGSGTCGSVCPGYYGNPGGGGGQSSGGSGGANYSGTYTSGTTGTQTAGGTGGIANASYYACGGGGGGGYWGGGGGGCSYYAGAFGGGGGSNYINPSATSTITTSGVNNGAGYVIITPVNMVCSGAGC